MTENRQQNRLTEEPLSSSEIRISQQPIRILLPYWEIRSTSIAKRLDDLIESGIDRVTTFVPWHIFETDIQHSLTKFLQAAFERRIYVSLIATPELGVHCQNSGFPKDLLQNETDLASTRNNKTFVASMPPNIFALPSVFSPEYRKRYFSFLARVHVFLSDFERVHRKHADYLEIIATGSLWKYYRDHDVTGDEIFRNASGDFSKNAAIGFRQWLEKHFSQREYLGYSETSVSRWKSPAFEDLNRRLFFQQSEEVFRIRTLQTLTRSRLGYALSQVELYTPDADPSFLYSGFLRSLGHSYGDFQQLSQYVDQVVSRASSVGDEVCPPIIHWSDLGQFRTLSESERQFLVLKSLLLAGGMGGGILLHIDQWLQLSQSFRNRTGLIAKALSQRRYQFRAQGYYLSPHIWSAGGTLWKQIKKKTSYGMKLTSSATVIDQDDVALLVVIDPEMIITQEILERVFKWCAAGRIVALPRTPLYTEAAKAMLETFFEQRRGTTDHIDVKIGLPYQIHNYAEGRLVTFDLPDWLAFEGELDSIWGQFVESILGLAEVAPVCKMGDDRLSAIPLARRTGDGRGTGLFILNGTNRSVSADLFFDRSVTISDLTTMISSEAFPNPASQEKGTRFGLEVPPCGVIPLSVEGLSNDALERRQAARIAALETFPPMAGGFEEATHPWN